MMWNSLRVSTVPGEPARWCEVKLFLCSAVVSLGGREGGPARFLKGEAVIIYSTERGSLRLIFYAVPAKIEFPK